MKKVLHVGCGHKRQNTMVPYFRGPDWKEIALDVDPACKPDIVASMIDMRAVETGSIDAVYSIHNLEHLHPYDGLQALREFLRVLRADGIAAICVPNLEFAVKVIVEKGIEEPAYQSPAGPVTPLDMIYGGVHLTRQNPFMQHRNGFTVKSMKSTVAKAGFAAAAVVDRQSNIWVLAFKGDQKLEDLKRAVATIIGD